MIVSRLSTNRDHNRITGSNSQESLELKNAHNDEDLVKYNQLNLVTSDQKPV